MGLVAEIGLFGDTQLSREIMRVGTRSRDMDPVFKHLFDRLQEIEGEQFHSQGARGGTPWAPLKPETIKSKKAKGYSDPALAEFATHALYEALASPASPNNERIYNREWAVFRIIGEPADYGAIQHHGAEANNLPSRPLIHLHELDRREFVKEMQRWIFSGKLSWDWSAW